jgi:hypothetical protein
MASAEYVVIVHEHRSAKVGEKYEGAKDYEALSGSFEDCWSFAEALRQVKPIQPHGMLKLPSAAASPFRLTIMRKDAKGAKFRIENKGGDIFTDLICD